MMPHKFNASRRHKFEKKRQKVTNWRVYNEGYRQVIGSKPQWGTTVCFTLPLAHT
jgi:hypothetical protein